VVRKKFQQLYDGYIAMIETSGANLMGSQPTQGNIRGGLSTIEEKALGNIAKTGTVPVMGALEPAVAPARRGLNFMDTSSAAAECITLFAAAGAVVHLFPTGQGNVIGNPLVPVIKFTAKPHTAATPDRGRRADGDHRPHRQRPLDLLRGARAQGVRPHQAVSERVRGDPTGSTTGSPAGSTNCGPAAAIWIVEPGRQRSVDASCRRP
jgi:hypothetical protein